MNTYYTINLFPSLFLKNTSRCLQVDNKVLLDEFSADKDSIVKNITRAFAHQIFVDGFYTADPHPGEWEKKRREK